MKLIASLAFSLAAPLSLSCGSAASTDGAPVDRLANGAAVASYSAYRESSAQPDDYVRAIGVDEALLVAGQVLDLFRAAAATDHSADLYVTTDLDNTNLGARAIFPSSAGTGRRWGITIHGGSFTQRLTRDVTRAMICHELGHFLAGFPFKEGWPQAYITYAGSYPSVEGQSDYFSTKDCLWRVWTGDPNNALYRELVPQRGRDLCDSVWTAQPEQDMCYRSVAVGLRVAYFLGNLPGTDTNGGISVDHPSTAVVAATYGADPDNQCRLDTLVAGALCINRNDLAVIPGLVPSPVTGLYGDHSVASETAAQPYACYDGPGARPACWFKAHMPDIVLYDCSGIPDDGMCDSNDIVSCTPRWGITRFTCVEGCIIYDDPNGTSYPMCIEDLSP
jgi:hypothetical protein